MFKAIRNNYESLSKQKKQMVSDFELQLSLIGKQLVESFRQKLDEVAMGNSDGRNQVYTNTVRWQYVLPLNCFCQFLHLFCAGQVKQSS